MAFEKLEQNLHGLLETGHADQLEAALAQTRATKNRMAGGSWTEWELVKCMARTSEGTDASWEAHIGRLSVWAAQTQSPIARVILAEAWVRYAWKARGSGYAEKVTSEGWKNFGQRLGEARKTLENIPKAQRSIISWYRCMMTVALGQDWPRSDYDQLFREAVGMEPSCVLFYEARACYLLPRWHGQEGEMQAFVNQEADRISGAGGDAFYFFAVLNQVPHGRNDAREFFHEPGNNWRRLKMGFLATDIELGVTSAQINRMAQLACARNDREEARRLFERIGDAWHPDVWKEKGRFDDQRDWAYFTGKYTK